MKRLTRAALAACLVASILPRPAAAQAPIVTQPFGATSTETAGTVTLGATFQTALASSSNRKGCLVQNTGTRTLYVHFGALASASTTTAFQVQPGGSISCAAGGGVVLTDNVNLTTTTTADPYVLGAQ